MLDFDRSRVSLCFRTTIKSIERAKHSVVNRFLMVVCTTCSYLRIVAYSMHSNQNKRKQNKTLDRPWGWPLFECVYYLHVFLSKRSVSCNDAIFWVLRQWSEELYALLIIQNIPFENKSLYFCLSYVFNEFYSEFDSRSMKSTATSHSNCISFKVVVQLNHSLFLIAPWLWDLHNYTRVISDWRGHKTVQQWARAHTKISVRNVLNCVFSFSVSWNVIFFSVRS